MTTRITEVEVQNVMKIRYAAMTPENGMTVVGGNNAQGKSSLLDAVAMALGGKRLCPAKPIREGARRGSVKVRIAAIPELLLEACTVVRTFERRPDQTIRHNMEIIIDDGSPAPEPQTLLNRLLSNATFDPLFFTRLKPADQAKQLRELAGIDDTPLRQRQAQLHETRLLVNRELNQLKGELAGRPRHAGVPDTPLQSAAIVSEMHSARAANAHNAKRRGVLPQLEAEREQLYGRIQAAKDAVAEHERQINILLDQIVGLEQVVTTTDDRIAAEANTAAGLVDVDLTIYERQLAELDGINAKVRANLERADVARRLQAAQAKADGLTAAIENGRDAIATMYEQATWPIEGLSFAADGVTYRGLPFEQCSSAEQLQVSVAIGFALNPQLKLLIIRDGSLLDEASLAYVATMAEQAGGQVFVERVGEGAECHLVMRDGAVVGQDAASDEDMEVDCADVLEV